MSFFSCYDVVKFKNTKNRPTQYLKQTNKVAGSYGSLSNLGNFFGLFSILNARTVSQTSNKTKIPVERSSLILGVHIFFFFLTSVITVFDRKREIKIQFTKTLRGTVLIRILQNTSQVLTTF